MFFDQMEDHKIHCDSSMIYKQINQPCDTMHFLILIGIYKYAQNMILDSTNARVLLLVHEVQYIAEHIRNLTQSFGFKIPNATW